MSQKWNVNVKNFIGAFFILILLLRFMSKFCRSRNFLTDPNNVLEIVRFSFNVEFFMKNYAAKRTRMIVSCKHANFVRNVIKRTHYYFFVKSQLHLDLKWEQFVFSSSCEQSMWTNKWKKILYLYFVVLAEQ